MAGQFDGVGTSKVAVACIHVAVLECDEDTRPAFDYEVVSMCDIDKHCRLVLRDNLHRLPTPSSVCLHRDVMDFLHASVRAEVNEIECTESMPFEKWRAVHPCSKHLN